MNLIDLIRDLQFTDSSAFLNSSKDYQKEYVKSMHERLDKEFERFAVKDNELTYAVSKKVYAEILAELSDLIGFN